MCRRSCSSGALDSFARVLGGGSDNDWLPSVNVTTRNRYWQTFGTSETEQRKLLEDKYSARIQETRAGRERMQLFFDKVARAERSIVLASRRGFVGCGAAPAITCLQWAWLKVCCACLSCSLLQSCTCLQRHTRTGQERRRGDERQAAGPDASGPHRGQLHGACREEGRCSGGVCGRRGRQCAWGHGGRNCCCWGARSGRWQRPCPPNVARKAREHAHRGAQVMIACRFAATGHLAFGPGFCQRRSVTCPVRPLSACRRPWVFVPRSRMPVV